LHSKKAILKDMPDICSFGQRIDIRRFLFG